MYYKAYAESVRMTGGATINTSDGALHNPKSGFAVSLRGYEETIDMFDSDSLNAAIERPHGAMVGVIVSELSTYALPNAKRSYQTPLFIGLWYDIESETLYGDITTIVPTLGEAVALGKANKQKAIFDFSTGETITL